MSNNPFLDRILQNTGPQETLEERKARNVQQQEEEKLNIIDPFGLEFLDADTLRNPKTGERFRVVPNTPGRAPNTYETDPRAYEGIEGRRRFEWQAKQYEEEHGIRPTVADLVREGQAAKKQVQEQFPLDERTRIQTNEELDRFGRTKVTVERWDEEGTTDLGNTLSQKGINSAYGIRQNLGQQLADAASGRLMADMVGAGPRSREEIIGDVVAETGNAFVKMGAEAVTEAGNYITPKPFALAQNWLAQNVHNLFSSEENDDTGSPFDFIAREYGISQKIMQAVEERSDKNISIEEHRRRNLNARWRARQDELLEQEKQANIAQGMPEWKAETQKQVTMFGRVMSQMKRDPLQAVNLVVNSAPYLVGGIAAAGVRGRMVFAKMAKKHGKDWMKDPKLLRRAGLDIGLTANTVNAGLEGISSSAEARQQVMEMKQEELEKSPLYQELLAQGVKPESARLLVADRVAGAHLVVNSAITFGTNALLGVPGMMTRAGTGSAFRKGTEDAVRGPLRRTGDVAEGFVKEGGQELGEGAGQNVAGNAITQTYLDPNQSLTENLGAEAADSVTAGSVSGGVISTSATAAGAVRDAFTLGKGTKVPNTPEAKTLLQGIDQAVKKYNLPPLVQAYLTAIVDIESSFNPEAVGPRIGIDIKGDPAHYGKRARGPFQFMPSVAQQYGLKNPHDPIQSADAAARLFMDNYNAIKKAHPNLSEPELIRKAALAHHSGAGNVSKDILGIEGRKYKRKLEARVGKGLGKKIFEAGEGKPIRAATPEDISSYDETIVEVPEFEGTVEEAEAVIKRIGSKEDITQEDFSEFESAANFRLIELEKEIQKYKKEGNEQKETEAFDSYIILRQGLESLNQTFRGVPTADAINNLRKGSGEGVEVNTDSQDIDIGTATSGLVRGVGIDVSLDGIDKAVANVLEKAKAIPGITDEQLRVAEEKLGGFKSKGPGRAGTRGLLHYKNQIVAAANRTFRNDQNQLVPSSIPSKVGFMDRALGELGTFLKPQLDKEQRNQGTNATLDALLPEENALIQQAFEDLVAFRNAWAQLNDKRASEHNAKVKATGEGYEQPIIGTKPSSKFTRDQVMSPEAAATRAAPFSAALGKAAARNQAEDDRRKTPESAVFEDLIPPPGTEPFGEGPQTPSEPSTETTPSQTTAEPKKGPQKPSEPAEKPEEILTNVVNNELKGNIREVSDTNLEAAKKKLNKAKELSTSSGLTEAINNRLRPVVAELNRRRKGASKTEESTTSGNNPDYWARNVGRHLKEAGLIKITDKDLEKWTVNDLKVYVKGLLPKKEIQISEKAVVEKINKAFNLDTTYFDESFVDSDAFINFSPLALMEFINQASSGYAWDSGNGKIFVGVFGDQYPKRRYATLLHEMGHAIDFTHFRNADENTKKALFKEFDEYVKTLDNKELNLTDKQKRESLVGNLNARYGVEIDENAPIDPAYDKWMRTFKEWKAERIKQWIDRLEGGDNPKKLGLIDTYFKELAQLFKDFWNKYVKSSLPTSESINSWMNSLYKIQPNTNQTQEGVESTKPINIWFGSKENAHLSNFANRPFEHEGREYISVEHAYQTLKTGTFNEERYKNFPNDRKKDYKNKAKTEDDYNLKLMEDLILKSFQNNTAAKNQLLSTGDRPFTHIQEKSNWKTWFPEILTKVREKLKEEPTVTEEELPDPEVTNSTEIFKSQWNKGDITKGNVLLLTQNFNKWIEEAKEKARSFVATIENFHNYLKNNKALEKLIGRELSENEQSGLKHFNDFRDQVADVIKKNLLSLNDIPQHLWYEKFNEAPYNYLRRNFNKDPDKEGNTDLNENTITAIASSLYDYMATMARKHIHNNDETIASILGIQPWEVTADHFKEFVDRGNLRKNVVESLGKVAWQQHNLKIKDNHIDSLLKNRMETSLGLLALEAGIELGLFVPEGKVGRDALTIERFNALINVNQKTYKEVTGDKVDGPNVPFVRLAVDEELEPTKEVQAVFDNFDKIKKLSQELFDIERDPIDVTFEVPDKARANIPGSLNRAPQGLLDAIKEFQKERYIPDPALKGFIENMTRQEFLENLLGWKNPDDVQLYFRDSQKGKNLQAERAYDALKKHFDEHGDKPFYFTYGTKANLRGMVDSRGVNYQASKLHRAFMVNDAWEVTVDLNDTELLNNFKLAVGLWMGVKVDKEVIDADGEFIRGIDAVLEENKAVWEMLMAKEEGTPYSKDELALLKPVLEAEEGPETLAALRAWADYKKAERDGQESFKTFLSDEVDGLTNGLAISLLQIPSSPEAVLGLLAKVGIFSHDLVEQGITNFADAKAQLEDFVDNYQQLAIEVSRLIGSWADPNQTVVDLNSFAEDIKKAKGEEKFELAKSLEEEAKKRIERQAWGPLIAKLLPELAKESGEVTGEGRNFSKNPIMRGNYGAGEGSIKGSIEELAIEKFYQDIMDIVEEENSVEEITKKLQDKFSTIANAVKAIPPSKLTRQWKVSSFGAKDVGKVENFKFAKGLNALKKQVREYQLPESVANTLRHRTKETYGQAAWNGLNTILGEQFAIRDKIVQAISLMNAVYIASYNKFVENKKKALGRPPSDLEIRTFKEQLREKGLYPSFRTAGTKKDVPYKQMLEVTAEALELASFIPPGEKQDYGQAAAHLKNGNKTQKVQRYEPSMSVGMKGYVRAIQAMDAYIISQIFKGENVQHIFDAFKGSFKDIDRISEKADKIFLEVNREYSVVEAVNERVGKFLEAISKDANLYISVATLFNDPKREQNLENFPAEWDEVVTTTTENRKAIFAQIGASNQFNRYGTAYKPDTTPTLGSTSEAIDRDWFTETYTGQLTADTVKSIYDNIITSLDQQQISAEHAAHLQRMMNEFIVSGFRNVDILQLNIGVGEQVTNNVGEITGSEIFLGAAGNKISSPQRMSLRETAVHEYVHAISQHFLDAKENYWAVKQLERLFNRAKEVITPDMLILRDESGNIIGDPDIAKEVAQERYDYIFNNPEGNMLHEFLAIGLTNEPFRKALARFDLKPERGEQSTESLFSWNPLQLLWNLFNRAMQWLNARTYAVAQGGSKDLSAGLEAFTAQMIATATKQAHSARESAFERRWRELGDKANAAISNVAWEAAEKKAQEHLQKEFGSKDTDLRRRATIETGRKVVESTAQTVQDAIDNLRGKTGGFNLIRDLWKELAGLKVADKKQARSLKLMSMQEIDQNRQRIRNSVTAMVRDAFDPKKPLREHEWEALSAVGIKTDLETLTRFYTRDQILEMIEFPLVLDQNIREVTNELQSKFGSNGNAYAKQAMGLGILMAKGMGTKEIERQQLNAHNIARMFFLDAHERPELTDLEEAENLIDRLASMSALAYTSKAQKDTFAAVARHEVSRGIKANGIDVMLGVVAAHKAMSLEKNFDGNRTSTVKGYIKENYDPDITMEIGQTSNAALESRKADGWKFVGFVEKDPAHSREQSERLGIFVQGIGLPAYRKSIFGMEDPGHKGADLKTSFEESTTKYFTRKERLEAMQKIDKALKVRAKSVFTPDFTLTPATGKLIPVLSPDKNGKTVNYRYMMNEKTKVEVLKKKDLAHEALGAMMGSIEEKVKTKEINRFAVEHLAEEYRVLRNQPVIINQQKFVKISPNSPDPKLRERWKMLPADTKIAAEQVFGDKYIMMRKDMLDYFFGFRDVSLSREFIPRLNTQLSKAGMKIPGNVAVGIHIADKIFRETVGFVRVRSSLLLPAVVVGNTISNTLLLLADGVPPTYAIRKAGEGTVAIREYTKVVQEIKQLETALAGAVAQGKETKQLQARLAFLDKKRDQSPVHEMVEQGLIQTIVEDVNPDVFAGPFSATTGYKKAQEFFDKALTQVKVDPARVKKARETNELIRGGSTVLENVLMLPGSQTFSVAITMNQMGDAVSRYIKYSYDTEVRKVNKLKARNDALDYFIFYDEPAPRWINTLNDYGFWLFSRFFLRIQKVALKMYGEKPANMIAQHMLESFLGDQDTIDDYLMNTTKLGYNTSITPQIGPDDFFHIPSLEWLDFFTP